MTLSERIHAMCNRAEYEPSNRSKRYNLKRAAFHVDEAIRHVEKAGKSQVQESLRLVFVHLMLLIKSLEE